jgi:two-component system response regulator NreC
LDGLRALLEQDPQFRIAATAKNGQEALEQVAANAIDVAVLDIDMPVLNGLDTCRQLRLQGHDVRVLLLSMHHEPALVQKAIEAGADGYLLKTAEAEELTFALKQVAKGKLFFDTSLFLNVKADDRPGSSAPGPALNDLTTRETEILRMIALGRSNNEIGSELYISPKTVDTHRTNLMRKLNARNVASLTRIALEAGLIQ